MHSTMKMMKCLFSGRQTLTRSNLWAVFSLALVVWAGLTSGCATNNAGVSGVHGNPEVIGGRANAELNKGDFNAAIADYTEIITLDPKLPAPYANRGLAKQAKGDLNGAIADDDKAIELDPNFAAAYHNRGLVKMDQHDFAGAVADFSKAIELSPNFAVAYYNRGRARQAEGDIPGSVADHDKAVALSPALGNLTPPR